MIKVYPSEGNGAHLRSVVEISKELAVVSGSPEIPVYPAEGNGAHIRSVVALSVALGIQEGNDAVTVYPAEGYGAHFRSVVEIADRLNALDTSLGELYDTLEIFNNLEVHS